MLLRMASQSVPLRLGSRRSAQNSSSPSRFHSSSPSQTPPQLRRFRTDSLSIRMRTTCPSPSSAGARSDGNNLSWWAYPLLVERLDGVPPLRVLRVVQIAKVERLPLEHASADAHALHQAPVDMDLSILPTLVRFQKHAGIVARFRNDAMGHVSTTHHFGDFRR